MSSFHSQGEEKSHYNADHYNPHKLKGVPNNWEVIYSLTIYREIYIDIYIYIYVKRERESHSLLLSCSFSSPQEKTGFAYISW